MVELSAIGKNDACRIACRVQDVRSGNYVGGEDEESASDELTFSVHNLDCRLPQKVEERQV